jgi:dolichol kinase
VLETLRYEDSVLVYKLIAHKASIVGYNFGRLRWPGSKKTFEGTLAAVLSVFSCCMLLLVWMQDQVSSSIGWQSTLWSTIIVSVLEATIDQVDNLFLPLIYVALLR